MENDKEFYLHYRDRPINIFRQYLAAALVSLGHFTFGVVVIQSTMMTHHLQLNQVYTDHQIYSAVAITAIGMMVGAAASSLPLTYCGPRTLTILLCPPTVGAAVMTSYGGSLTTLLLGRLALGVANGLCFSCTPAFIGSVSSGHRRGLLSTLPDLLTPLGSIVVSILGAAMSWNSGTLLLIAACQGVKLVGLLTVHESPRWLRAYGCEQASKSSWTFYHTTDENASGTVLYNTMDLDKNSFVSASLTWPEMFRQLRQKHVLIPVGISCLMYQMKIACGSTVIFYYGLKMIKESSSGDTGMLDISVCLAGALVGSAVACRLCDRVGRRPLLLVTSAVNTLLLVTLTLVFEADTRWPFLQDSPWSWTPIVLAATFLLTVSTGISPLADVLNSDLVPSALAPLANSVIFLMQGLGTFTSLSLTPYMLDWLGRSTVFAGLAASNFALIPVTYFLLPETKNLELEEIQEMFRVKFSRAHKKSRADQAEKSCHDVREVSKHPQEEDEKSAV